MAKNNKTDAFAKLYLVENRVKTFTRWPFSDDQKCNVKNMAEAGFYSTSTGNDDCDSATCFLCGKELDGWEPTDDPWVEHKNHAAHCAFVQLGKNEGDLLLSEFLSVVKQYMMNEVRRHEEQSLQHLNEKVIMKRRKLTVRK